MSSTWQKDRWEIFLLLPNQVRPPQGGPGGCHSSEKLLAPAFAREGLSAEVFEVLRTGRQREQLCRFKTYLVYLVRPANKTLFLKNCPALI